MNERLDLLEIRAYDQAWLDMFAQQQQELTPVLAGVLVARADPSDRVRYRAGKAPLIAEIMVMARTWRPPTDP